MRLKPGKLTIHADCSGVEDGTSGRNLAEFKAGLLFVIGQLDVLGEANRLEGSDDHPGGVQLPPLEAMAGRPLEGMMVVMPALPKRKRRHPPVVA